MSIEALSTVVEAASAAAAPVEVVGASVALPLSSMEVLSASATFVEAGISMPEIGEFGVQMSTEIPDGVSGLDVQTLVGDFAQVDATSLENVRAELSTFQKNAPDEIADVIEPALVDTQDNIESLDTQNNFLDDVSLDEDTTNGENPTGEDVDTTEQKNIDEDKTTEESTDESKEEAKEEDQTEEDPEKEDEETSEEDEQSEEESEDTEGEEEQEDEEEKNEEEEKEDEKKKKKEERPEQIVPSYVPDVDEQRVGQLTTSIVKSAAENGGRVNASKVAREFTEKAVVSPILTSSPIGLPEATPSMSATDGTISLIRQQMESLGDAAGVKEAVDTTLSAVDANPAIGWGNALAAEGDIAKVTGATLRRSAGKF